MNGVVKAKGTISSGEHHVSANNASATTVQQDLGPTEALPDNDIFAAARYGDWQRIESLIQAGSTKATDVDEQGITALHWAAINDRLLACKTLVDHGADVNAHGGDLNATPMMWAAKNGHVYIVHFLMTRGGDPALMDKQGYNSLQLATHSSNILLLIYLLHVDLPVDSLDPQKHTCLMWAAYQGDVLSVDTLLKWGANVNAKDEDGLNALHWSIVRGNKQCIQRVIEEGGDLSAKQNEQKDARMLANELKTSKAFEAALVAVGRDETSGLCKMQLLSKSLSMKTIFLMPIASLGLILKLLSMAPIVLSLVLSPIILYLFHLLNTKIILPPNLRSSGIHQTPHLAGIFFASAFWTIIHWVLVVIPSIGQSWPVLNLIFGLIFAFALYNFFRALSLDPGFIPTTGGRAEQREAIEELLRDGEFDNQHFCIYCLLRKPLRSKHCKICRRCVAKHDHHCPWINNCVGVRNHKQFIQYVYALFLGIPLYAILVHLHIKRLGAPRDPIACTLLADVYCRWIQIDSFGLFLAIWDCLQMTWITMLVCVQSWQIAKATTTQEVIHVRRHGFMGAPPDKRRTSVSAQVVSVISGGTTDPGTAALDAHGQGPSVGHAHAHGHASAKTSMMTRVARLLGIDQFVDTARESLAERRGRRKKRFINPFDGGVKSNCTDFWQQQASVEGAGLVKGQAVDYYRLYAMPVTTEMYTPLAIEEAEV